jgi:hypothetical protein
LAPQVQRFQQIVRQEFYLLHVMRDQLVGLRDQAWEDLWNGPLCNERAATAAKLLLERMPQHGLLELVNTQTSEYMTS